MTTPLDILLGLLSDATNAVSDLDTDDISTADLGLFSTWEAKIDAITSEIQAWQSAHSHEAEESASDMDWERRIDEAKEEGR